MKITDEWIDERSRYNYKFKKSLKLDSHLIKEWRNNSWK